MQNNQNMQNMHTWYTMTGVRLQDRDVGALELLETRVCLSLNAEQGQYPAEPHIVKPQLEPPSCIPTLLQNMQEYAKYARIFKKCRNTQN